MFTKCHYLQENFLPRTNMSELQMSVLMRRLYLTGLQEVGVYFRRGLKPPRDVIHVGQTPV